MSNFRLTSALTVNHLKILKELVGTPCMQFLRAKGLSKAANV